MLRSALNLRRQIVSTGLILNPRFEWSSNIVGVASGSCGYMSLSPSSSSSPSSYFRTGDYLRTRVASMCSASPSSGPSDENVSVGVGGGGGGDDLSVGEAKRLMRLVNVEALKMKLGMEGKEVICYKELLEACESLGVARSVEEAGAFARVLDEAGVVLLFRDKVYLHPDKVVDLVRKAVPLALSPEDDPKREELKMLQKKKAEIDLAAKKQVSKILWSGLGISILQVGLFFRLTFWEFSWDVMEPIAFFTTATGIVIGYAYFLLTSRDPSYQDLMTRLFLSRQRKLYKKRDFDVNRYMELQKRCKCPLDIPTPFKGSAGSGLTIELETTLHGH